LRGINGVVSPDEANAQAYAEILDQRWKPPDSGVASGVPESDKRAADERKLNPVDRHDVIALDKKKAITAEREQIYRR
jgi:hypothetical protein